MALILRNILNPVLYMLFFIVAGYVLRKKNVLSDSATKTLSVVENNLVIPLLLLNNFMRFCTVESLRANLKAVLVSLAIALITMAAAKPLSRLFYEKGYLRNVYRYAMQFTSYGYLGYGLIQVLFGDEALYRFILFVLPINLMVYCHGLPLLTPENEKPQSFWRCLLQPPMLSILAGSCLGLLNVYPYVPVFLRDVLTAGSNIFSPMAMLITGVTVGAFSMKSLFGDRKIYGLTALRMLLMPVVFTALCFFIFPERELLIFVLIANACPAGLYPVIYPALFDEDTRPGAAFALVTNIVCVISLPLLYSLLCVLMDAAGIL